MEITVEHRPDIGRFQAEVEGRLNVADYALSGDVMLMTHTGVDPMLQGRGIAGKLVEAALVHARANGLKVNPLCSYVRAYLRRHPEHQDLAV